MRIYICAPQDFSLLNESPVREKLRSDLHEALKKYYGSFSASDIEFFWNNNIDNENNINVYIMEKSLRKNLESEIKQVIAEIIKKPLNVRLNYSACDPDFRPKNAVPTIAQKSETKTEAQKENQGKSGSKSSEFDYEKLSENYHAEEPHYSFEQVILPKETHDKILEAVATIQVEEKVFDEWGLRTIIPFASSAMSFYGPPGTGKSMAAEAVASMVGKKIIRATYADIESKYHGEGPKMVKAIFKAAERDKAVLFLDESDSLLSKRLTNVTEGSAQAINSMRSQLLISLERFKGIVIFATNLIVNYDKAFLSRLISIEFPMPDAEARKVIWQKHIRGEGINIPLSDDVNTDNLAIKYNNFCGREIKNAVKDACVMAAMQGRDTVTQSDLVKSCEKIKTELKSVANAADYTQNRNGDKKILSPELNNTLKSILQEKAKSQKIN